MKKKIIIFLSVLLTIALVSCTKDKEIILNEDATKENEKLINDMGIEVKEERLESKGIPLRFLDDENLLTIESNEDPENNGVYSMYVYNSKSKKTKKIPTSEGFVGYNNLGDGENLIVYNTDEMKLYLYNWKSDKMEMLFDLSTDAEIAAVGAENQICNFDRVYESNNLVSYTMNLFEDSEMEILEGKSIVIDTADFGEPGTSERWNKGKTILIDTNTKKKYNLMLEEEGFAIDGQITYIEDKDIYYLISYGDIYSFKIGTEENIEVKKLNTDNVNSNITFNALGGFIDKSGNYISTYPGEGAPISFLNLETMEETIKPVFDNKTNFEISAFNYETGNVLINANTNPGEITEGDGITPELYLGKIINSELVLFNKIKDYKSDGKKYQVIAQFNESGNKVMVIMLEEINGVAAMDQSKGYKIYTIE